MSFKKDTDRLRRKKRLRAKISGSTERPRLSVFKSLTTNYAQIVDDTTGLTICSTSDIKVKKGTKSEKAKQVGLDIAKIAKEKKIEKVVFDRNGYKYHGRIKAIADGAREGGLVF